MSIVTSETSVNFYQTTLRYNPEDSDLQEGERISCRLENCHYLSNLQGKG
jgi:hypothetical protein